LREAAFFGAGSQEMRGKTGRNVTSNKGIKRNGDENLYKYACFSVILKNHKYYKLEFEMHCDFISIHETAVQTLNIIHFRVRYNSRY
jgi:hypothetical protein